MKKEKKIIMEGIVTDAYPGDKFNIELKNGHELTGYVSGKMRRFNIRVLLGDRVKVEVSPYDLERGRITYRYKRKSYDIKQVLNAESASLSTS
jgi:translation initiation factor IF-1